MLLLLKSRTRTIRFDIDDNVEYMYFGFFLSVFLSFHFLFFSGSYVLFTEPTNTLINTFISAPINPFNGLFSFEEPWLL